MYVCMYIFVCMCAYAISGETQPQPNYVMELEYKCDIVGISRRKHATNQQIVSHAYDSHVSFDRFACVV